MRKTRDYIFCLVLFLGAVGLAVVAAPQSAWAAAGAVTQTIANSDPCAPSGGFCDPTNAEEGADTITYDYTLTANNDDLAHTFKLQFGTSVGAGTDEATTNLTVTTCGTTVVLPNAPTIDNTNVGTCSPAAWDATNNEVDWDSGACATGGFVRVTWDITFCSGSAGSTYDFDTLCAKSGGVATCGTPEYIDQWGVNVGAVPTLEQVAYKWFANTDTAGVGASGARNTRAIAPPAGTPFRLRMLLHVSDAQLNASATTSKLQYAVRGADNRCGNDFSADTDETYVDVSSTTGDILAYINPSVSDGATLLQSFLDPRHASTSNGLDVDTVNLQVYSEGAWNLLTNSVSAVPQDEDVLYGFALVVSTTTAPYNTNYCLRMVQFDGGLFTGGGVSGYGTSSIAKLRTAQAVKVRFKGIVRLRSIVRLR